MFAIDVFTILIVMHSDGTGNNTGDFRVNSVGIS